MVLSVCPGEVGVTRWKGGPPKSGPKKWNDVFQRLPGPWVRNHHQEEPRTQLRMLLKMQVQIQVWARAWGSTVPVSPQRMLTLLVQGPHFECQGDLHWTLPPPLSPPYPHSVGTEFCFQVFLGFLTFIPDFQSVSFSYSPINTLIFVRLGLENLDKLYGVGVWQMRIK